MNMNEDEINRHIRQELSSAPRNQYIVELHLQMIKYADELEHITAKAFCEGIGLNTDLL
nr:hypothetical protein [Escherichia coli]